MTAGLLGFDTLHRCAAYYWNLTLLRMLFSGGQPVRETAMTAHVSPVVETNRAQDLMRLGWAIAEIRGRVYFRPSDPGCIAGQAAVHASHPLPLFFERSSADKQIEAEQVVQELAKRTGLELDGSQMKDSRGDTPATSPTAAARIAELAGRVPEDRSEPSWHATWNAFTMALYQWDSAIQDKLASASFGESSAYQLGRGLAECSWALDPNCPPNDVMGWEHVLGRARCVALTRLLERLIPAVPAETASAIKGSLAAWERVARDSEWRKPPAPIFLRQQIDVWRDMIVVGTEPQTFERSPGAVQNIANIFPIIKGLWAQMVIGLVSVGILGVGIWAITEYGNSKPWGLLVSALGVFGITASSLLANAEKKVTGLVDRVQVAVAADERAKAATIIPDRPKDAKVACPGRLSTPGSFAEPISLPELAETSLLPGTAT
jgi:hypothetical protein